MAAPDPRLTELIDKLEAALGELKAYLGDAEAGPAARPEPDHGQALKAFADEALRARDA